MPAWVLVAAFFGAALLLAPVLVHGWLERFLAERRAYTEGLAARVRDAERARPPAATAEARSEEENPAVPGDRPLR